MSSEEGTVEVEALAGVREVLEFTAPGSGGGGCRLGTKDPHSNR